MKINVTHIAKLANLSLTEEEKKKLSKQLDETLAYVDQLDQVNTDNVQPTSQVTGLENVTREDVAAKSLTQAQALSNTKNEHKGFFKVKGILDNE